jgi:hypothetical protein
MFSFYLNLSSIVRINIATIQNMYYITMIRLILLFLILSLSMCDTSIADDYTIANSLKDTVGMSANVRAITRDFGMNITEALANPLEAAKTTEDLRTQVAKIFYDLRMMGGRSARWISKDVWPQWRCGLDPEDQLTGEVDPAWFIVTRVLLEEAKRNDIKIIIVLSDLAHSSQGALTANKTSFPRQFEQWADHRRLQIGLDGYQGSIRACPDGEGYYGAVGQDTLFSQPAFRTRLAHRFAAMARHLVQFPALGAIEMFNEPDFRITSTPGFWLTVRQLRLALRQADSRVAEIPVLSGTAWWDRDVLSAASREGDLAREPFIATHWYGDFGSASGPSPSIGDYLSKIRNLVPEKDILVAEAGSSTSIYNADQHKIMVDQLLKSYLSSRFGLMVWGDWFEQPVQHDFKLDFNHRSEGGDAFRDYFFSDREPGYAKAMAVTVRKRGMSAPTSTQITIEKISASVSNAWLRSKWAIDIDGRRFVGFSRAGVFARPYEPADSRLSPPPNTFFTSTLGNNSQWASVSFSPKNWILNVYECENDTMAHPALGVTLTPLELLGLASDEKRKQFENCNYSTVVLTGQL